jgi:hypothetical protein
MEKLKEVEKITGKKLRNFMTVDFGRMEKTVPDTYSTVVENKHLYDFFEDIKYILSDDFNVFIGTTNFLAPINDENIKPGKRYSELVITKKTTWDNILRMAESDAINYGFDTEDLIKKIKEYDEKYGIEISHAETDTVVLEFNKLPENLLALTKDIYAFCPDIVDQGSGDINDIAETLDSTGSIFLWWD